MTDWNIETLRDFIRIVLEEYPIPEETFTHTPNQSENDRGEDLDVGRDQLSAFRDLIYQDGRRVVGDIIDEDYEISAPNQTNLAHIPYVAVHDSRETVSTTYGRDVVYLFDPYTDTAYLTLNIGAQKTAKNFANRLATGRDQTEILRSLATTFRQWINLPSGFETGSTDITSELNRSSPYNNGAICFKQYELDSLPSGNSLETDLKQALELYEQLVNTHESTIEISLEDRRAWQVSPELEQQRWDGWIENEVCSIGWSLDPSLFDQDLSEIDSLDETDVSRSEGQGLAYQFVHQISEGDIIIAGIRRKKSPHRVYGVGCVTETDPDLEDVDLHENIAGDSHFVGVDWMEFQTWLPITLGTNIPLTDNTLTELDESGLSHVLGMTAIQAVAGGLYDSVTDISDAIEKVVDISVNTVDEDDEQNGEPGQLDYKTWTTDHDAVFDRDRLDSLGELFFPEGTDGKSVEASIIRQVDTALRSGKHLILQGPPGTGKTELARTVVRYYVNDAHEMVTATADWSTFDTIGGYHPQADGTLKFEPGVFLDRFLTIPDDGEPEPTNEWLVIDELNRAEIDKAFGALFSALTGEEITLPFETEDGAVRVIGDPSMDESQEVTTATYFVPDDWRLLATMNTVDKSTLYKMSYAFMRRFAFVSVPAPESDEIEPSLIERYADEWDVEISDEVTVDVVGPLNDVGTTDTAPKTAVFEAVSELWIAVQEIRPIGPAIIRDILEYLSERFEAAKPIHDDDNVEMDLTDPITMYIFPQIDELPRDEQSNIVDALRGAPGTTFGTYVDEDRLSSRARDFLGVE